MYHFNVAVLTVPVSPDNEEFGEIPTAFWVLPEIAVEVIEAPTAGEVVCDAFIERPSLLDEPVFIGNMLLLWLLITKPKAFPLPLTVTAVDVTNR